MNKESPVNEPLLISVKQLAQMLNISRSQAYALLDVGAIDSRYIGRRRLVPLSAVKDYVANLPDRPPGV